MAETIGNDRIYLKSGVYMTVTLIDNTKRALIAAINRGHLVDKDQLDRGPFGGSFTLTPAEEKKLADKYPGIVFKGDSAHQDKLHRDAKIFFPEQYTPIIDSARKTLRKRFNKKNRITEAFFTEFEEEAFEEAFQDNIGNTYTPPLMGMKPEKVISKMDVQPFAHTTIDYPRTDKYDKRKDCWHTTVSMPGSVVKKLTKSDMIATLSHKHFDNGDCDGIVLTDVMRDGYKAAVDNGIIDTGKKIYIP